MQLIAPPITRRCFLPMIFIKYPASRQEKASAANAVPIQALCQIAGTRKPLG
jgi:hypothetical protein